MEYFHLIYFKAFGVGAFENDDVNIYTNYDLSQYDFAIDSCGTAPDASCNASNSFSDSFASISNKILLLASENRPLELMKTRAKIINGLDFYNFKGIIADDTGFVMASKRQLARHFFEPPRIPSNFRPLHIPIHPDISQMPLNIKQFSKRMNHLQRAKFLGEVNFFHC